MSSAAEEQQVLAGLTPDDYAVRLASASAYSATPPALPAGAEGQGWKILSEDIFNKSETTKVGPAETKQLTVRIFMPATLKVTAKSGSTNLTNATLFVTKGDRTDVIAASAQTAPGEWNLTTLFGGEKVIPGEYDLSVFAPNMVPQTHADISVPLNYPTTLSHVEAFNLTPATTSTVTRTIKDTQGQPINGASVTLSGGGISGTVTLTTSNTGSLTLPVPAGVTFIAESPYGHADSPSQTFASGSPDVVLAIPSGYFLIKFVPMNASDKVAKWGYRDAGATSGAATEFAYVLPNNLAQASAVVPAGTNNYKVEKRCATSVANTATLAPGASGATVTWIAGGVAPACT
jgi:hypothetical protein